MLDGGNDLAVAVFGPVAEAIVDAGVDIHSNDARARIRVALCRGDAGSLPGGDRSDELCVIVWDDATGPAPMPGGPVELRAHARVAHPWGPWRWETSPRLGDDATTRAEVLAAVALIHTPRIQGSTRVLLAASELKFKEVGGCYALDLSASRARFRSMWTELSKEPSFRVAPLQPDAVVVQRFCDGRLAAPLTSDGHAVIRQLSEDGSGWSLPLFFARVDGLLVVVR